MNAVDYLLKPVDPDRLDQAIERVRKRVESEKAAKMPMTPADLERVIRTAVQSREERRDQLAVRVGERFVLVQADEVIHASLVDESIVVVTSAMSGTSNYRTLDELQSRLDPSVFMRIHRRLIVNHPDAGGGEPIHQRGVTRFIEEAAHGTRDDRADVRYGLERLDGCRADGVDAAKCGRQGNRSAFAHMANADGVQQAP